jgi:hypothetical protein
MLLLLLPVPLLLSGLCTFSRSYPNFDKSNTLCLLLLKKCVCFYLEEVTPQVKLDISKMPCTRLYANSVNQAGDFTHALFPVRNAKIACF